MYKTIDRYEAPLNIFKYVKSDYDMPSIMNENDQTFLCGAIKMFRPKKIVEIGVAYGGTTALIANCLAMEKIECDIYSIDILENFRGNRTGEYFEQARDSIDMTGIQHTFFLGDVSPSFLNEVGGQIDMAIIDTSHGLPGELLEFLVLFPFLSKDAVVVLHDIVDHLYWKDNVGFEYATQLLLDSVVAEKFINEDDKRPERYPNIAAFRLNNDTSKYIGNVFGALNMTWLYMPDESQWNQYISLIDKKYGNEYRIMCDKARNLNKLHFARKEKKLTMLTKKFYSQGVYIYGAGEIGKQFYERIKNRDIYIKGFIISDDQKCEAQIDTITVKRLSDIKYNGELIVVSVGRKLKDEVEKNLINKDIRNTVYYSDFEGLVSAF